MTNTKQDVQFYSHLTKELKHSQEHKALKFLVNDCIGYDQEHKYFTCGPIEGYNVRTYTLTRQPDGQFVCNCQACQKQLKEEKPPRCSHILTLHLWFDNRNRLRGWGRHKQEQLEGVKE